MKKILIAVVAMFAASSAFAAPISYTYRGTYDYSYVGVDGNLHWGVWYGNAGPNYSVTIIFDNGGREIRNVEWNPHDFVSFSYVSGGAHLFFEASDVSNWNDISAFKSDDHGRLISGAIDTNGAWFYSFFGDVNVGGGGGGGYMEGANQDHPLVSLPGHFASVPEPTTLSLMGIGIFGLVAARRRRTI